MRGIEVIAMLGDSVVHTKDCVATRSTARAWLVTASVLSFLVAAIAFVGSLANAADNVAALLAHVAHERPTYSFRPAPRSVAIDVAMFAGLGVGLAFAIAALRRTGQLSVRVSNSWELTRRFPTWGIGLADLQ